MVTWYHILWGTLSASLLRYTLGIFIKYSICSNLHLNFIISKMEKSVNIHATATPLSCDHWSMSSQWGSCEQTHHYDDVKWPSGASRITVQSSFYLTLCSAWTEKHQSSDLLPLYEGNSLVPVDSFHKRTVTREMSPFEDIMMLNLTEWD